MLYIYMNKVVLLYFCNLQGLNLLFPCGYGTACLPCNGAGPNAQELTVITRFFSMKQNC